MKSYAKKNYGVMTAHKLMHFMKCPYTYNMKHELLQDMGDDEDRRCFIVGQAFDDVVSYGEDFFKKNYYIRQKGEKIVNEDKKEELEQRKKDLEKAIDEARVRGRGTKIKESQLLAVQQQLETVRASEGRILLSESEGAHVLSMVAEAKRQSLFEFGDEKYTAQKSIKCEWHGVIIGGTVDRISINDLILRDTKTVANIDKYKYSIIDYNYILQVAFYELLASVHCSGKRFRVFLDFFGKRGNNTAYMCVEIPSDILNATRKKIEDAIVFYAECKKTGIWPSHAEISHYDDRHKDCPYYDMCIGGVQSDPVMYQEFDYQ